MLLDDIATRLAAAGLGLTVGTNLFKVPTPESAADASVCIVEYGSGSYRGQPAVRAMGASGSAPIAEIVRFQVTVRDVQANFQTARTLAHNIYLNLDELDNATLGSTRYLRVIALQPPFYLGEDENARHRFVTNFEVWKERG